MPIDDPKVYVDAEIELLLQGDRRDIDRPLRIQPDVTSATGFNYGTH